MKGGDHVSHIHNVIDSDTHFVIDPLTRVISTTSEKLNLSVGDHNSEIYTFEIPKIVEGHDMSSCTRIEVHYNNVSKDKKNISSDVYLCPDSQVTGDTLSFSWLISRNATKYKGTLQFSIRFVCVDDEDAVVYDWRTATFKKVSVGDVVYNDAVAEESVSDTIEQIKDEIIQIVPTKVGQLENDTGYLTEHQSLDNYPTKTEMSDAIAVIPEQVQSDLSVNDEIDPAFVKGVIRKESLPDGYPYEVETDRYTVINASNISWRTSMGYSATVSPADNFVSFSAGIEYIIETNDYLEIVTCESDGEIYSSRISIRSRTDSQDYYLYTSNESYDTVKVVAVTYDRATLDEKFIPSYVAKLQYANIGQLAAVKTVDNSGVPTEWKALSIPSKIVTAVNGTAPDSKGNVTLNVYTKDELATVATSGKYQDLEGIPVSKTFSDVLRGFNQLTSTTINGNKFMKYSGDSSLIRNFLNEYSNKLVSFQFNSLGSDLYEVKDQTAKVVVSNTTRSYTIWGNCSLYSSSYEDTGENWCVYAGTTNGEVYAFYEGWSGNIFYAKYVKEEITQLSEEFIPSSIARSSDIPTDDHINELINNALGVIENGTY